MLEAGPYYWHRKKVPTASVVTLPSCTDVLEEIRDGVDGVKNSWADDVVRLRCMNVDCWRDPSLLRCLDTDQCFVLDAATVRCVGERPASPRAHAVWFEDSCDEKERQLGPGSIGNAWVLLLSLGGSFSRRVPGANGRRHAMHRLLLW